MDTREARPAPGVPGPSVPRTLAERIADAERAVIAHDEAVRQGVRELGDTARRTLRRRARAGMALGAGTLLLGLLWWRSGRRRRRAPPVAAARRRHPPGGRAHRQERARPRRRLLARLLSLLAPVVMPLLNARLREIVGPRTAALVMAVALPMLARSGADAHGEERRTSRPGRP